MAEALDGRVHTPPRSADGLLGALPERVLRSYVPLDPYFFLDDGDEAAAAARTPDYHRRSSSIPHSFTFSLEMPRTVTAAAAAAAASTSVSTGNSASTGVSTSTSTSACTSTRASARASARVGKILSMSAIIGALEDTAAVPVFQGAGLDDDQPLHDDVAVRQSTSAGAGAGAGNGAGASTGTRRFWNDSDSEPRALLRP